MADQKERIIIETVDNTTKGLRSAQNKLGKFERLVARVQTTLLGFVGINIGINLARGILRASDSAIELDAKLRLMTDSTEEFNEAQAALVEISRESGSSLEANTILFTRMNRSIKASGATMQDTLAVTRAISQGLRISGASAQESASVVRQFSQAMASGVLRGEEFNAIMENGGRISQALGDALGKSLGELRAMSKEGLLTADVVIPALTSQAKVLAEENAKLPLTIGRAFQNVKNEWISLLATFKSGNSFFADGINTIAQNFELVAKSVKVLLLVTTAYVAQLTAMNLQKRATELAQFASNWVRVRKEQQLAVKAAQQQAAFDEQATARNAGKISRLRQESIARAQLLLQQKELNHARAIGDVADLQASTRRQASLVKEQSLYVAQLKNVIARQQQAVKEAATTKQQAVAQQQLAGAYNLQLAAVGRLNASNHTLIASKKQLTLATGEQLVATSALTVAQGQLTVLQTTGSAAAAASAVKMTLFAGVMSKAGVAIGFVTTRLKGMGAALFGLPGLALYVAYELLSAFGDVQIAAIATGEALQKIWAVLDTPIGPGFFERLDAEFARIEERSSASVDKLLEDRERATSGGKSANDRFIESNKRAADAVLELSEAYAKLGIPIDLAASKALAAGKTFSVSAENAFETISKSAKTTGENIQRAFEGALRTLDTETGVEKVRKTIVKLGEDSKISGDQVASMLAELDRTRIDGVSVATVELSDALSDLGVDIGYIRDGISDLGQEGIASFDALVDRIDEAGVSAEQAGTAIIQGLVGALDKVRTVRAIEELKAKLNELEVAGKITGAQLAEGLSEAAEAAKAISEELDQSGEALSEFSESISAGDTAAALDRIGASARAAWSIGKISAEEYSRVMSEIARKKEQLIDKTNAQIQTERELSVVINNNFADAQRPIVRRVSFKADYAQFDDADAVEAGMKAAQAMRESFQRAMKPAIQLPHTYLKNFVAELDAVNKAGLDAAEAVLAVKRAEDRAKRATDRLNSSTERLVENRNTSVAQLEREEARLESFRATTSRRVDTSESLDKIRNRLNEIKSATESATGEMRGLQAELATTLGDEEEAARIRHESRLLALKEKLQIAQAEGNTEAVDIYTSSLKVLNKIGAEQASQRQSTRDDEAQREKNAQVSAKRREREARDSAAQRDSEDRKKAARANQAKTVTRPTQDSSSNFSPSPKPISSATPERLMRAFKRGVGGNSQVIAPTANTSTVTQGAPSETIAVKLTVGGQTGDGVFTKDDATMGMLDELRRSGEVTQ